MIDLKLLRASPGQVRAALARRGDASLTRLLDEIEALDMKRRTLTAQLDTLKAERNDAARADALAAKSQGGLPAAVVAERRKLGGGDDSAHTRNFLGSGSIDRLDQSMRK